MIISSRIIRDGPIRRKDHKEREAHQGRRTQARTARAKEQEGENNTQRKNSTQKGPQRARRRTQHTQKQTIKVEM